MWPLKRRTTPETTTATTATDTLPMPPGADETIKYPEGVVMFAPNAIRRTEGLPVDATLGNLLTMAHAPQARDTAAQRGHIHGLFHRTASISEIEPQLYSHCANNPTSIANWLPPLIAAHERHALIMGAPSALHIPRTQVMRLDEPLAQFTRVAYNETNQISRETFNAYLAHTFELNDTMFLKTGTFSGKFQYANCKVTEPDELGEYVQVVTNHAMVVGAGESIDIAVRDYIEDHDNTRPTIYGGMPLRCEYRVFVDFGHIDADSEEYYAARADVPLTRTALRHAFALDNLGAPHPGAGLPVPRVLGVTHYWHPRVMRAHLQRVASDAAYAQYSAVHEVREAEAERDTFYAYEDTLRELFDTHQHEVTREVAALLPYMQRAGFRGAWSIDVMVNREADGSDTFYLIDMALACESALVDELYTVDELRFVDVDTLRRVTDGCIFAYPDAPAFAEGEHVDGHGVTHRFVTGDTEAALAVGVEAGIIPTDGSAVPSVRGAHGDLVSGPVAGTRDTTQAVNGEGRHVIDK